MDINTLTFPSLELDPFPRCQQLSHRGKVQGKGEDGRRLARTIGRGQGNITFYTWLQPDNAAGAKVLLGRDAEEVKCPPKERMTRVSDRYRVFT